ncbi:MAG: TonB-dependent receptor [Burkholderiaceae bacterium]|nr:TonB-dependent receptor [Burkholderiaceae bacterium]
MTDPRPQCPTTAPWGPPCRRAPGARVAGLTAGLAAILAANASAQTTPAAPALRSLPEVRVTADPLAGDELRSTRPIGVLQAADIERNLDTSLGGTLAQQPGVQSSGFGTAAGRPVIRSQDGARVRVTQNGLDTMDVSTLSPDHAIAADPLAAERIEILRGPATLFYGGGAVGGLVNVVTRTIPTERLESLTGHALLSVDSASRGHSEAVALRAGAGGLNWSASVFERAGRDYRIPGQIVASDPESRARRLPNSFARGDGYSGGVSWIGDRVTLGVAHSALSNHYGIPSEDGVAIRLEQHRTEALALLERPLPGIARLRATLADGRYRHDEVEPGGDIGTAFRSSGREARVEATHDALAGVRGVLGLQSRQRSLSASGEEAYIPNASERSDALFYVAERSFGPARLELGWRTERTRLRPDSGTGLADRRFSLDSLSLGASLPVAPGYTLAANLSSSQRAPVIEELYANGPHAATGTFEIGDASLQRERSLNLDVSLRRSGSPLRWKIGVYANRFRNYVFGRGTDDNGDGVADRVSADNVLENSADDPGAGEFTRLVYAQARARFTGLEAEISYRFTGTPYTVRMFGDTARGRIDGQGNVPRLAPARVGFSADAESGPWSGFVSVLAVSGQRRIAVLETTTAGYTRVDAEVAYRLSDSPSRTVTVFLQGRNLLNETIRPHTSYVKDLVPQPGRTVMAGVRARF